MVLFFLPQLDSFDLSVSLETEWSAESRQFVIRNSLAPKKSGAYGFTSKASEILSNASRYLHRDGTVHHSQLRTHMTSFRCLCLHCYYTCVVLYSDSFTTVECDEACATNPPLSGIVWKKMADYLDGGNENFWTDGGFPTVIGEEPMYPGNAYFWNIYI